MAAVVRQSPEEYNIMKQSVCKICRRTGEKLFLKGERCLSQKCALIRRNYPPGMHGQKRQKTISEFGSQLKDRKKIKFKGQSNNLDYKIYALKLASSLKAARQKISHNCVLVNNKKVNISSYQVKEKDIIKIIK